VNGGGEDGETLRDPSRHSRSLAPSTEEFRGGKKRKRGEEEVEDDDDEKGEREPCFGGSAGRSVG
jgi:hypothetical protein